MFERFTERARGVVVLAQEEACELRHNYIGTEHILLGLLREEEGLAAQVLETLGVTAGPARDEVVRIVGHGEGRSRSGQIPFTPRAKVVLELALREALGLGHDYIGTEHILLGLARENEGVATRILLDFDADAETIRGEVIRMLRGSSGTSGRALIERPGERLGSPRCSRERRPRLPLEWHRAALLWRPEGLELRIPLRLHDGEITVFAADEVWANDMFAGLRREIWRGWLALASPTLLDDVDADELRRLLDPAVARATEANADGDRAESFLQRLRSESQRD